MIIHHDIIYRLIKRRVDKKEMKPRQQLYQQYFSYYWFYTNILAQLNLKKIYVKILFYSRSDKTLA